MGGPEFSVKGPWRSCSWHDQGVCVCDMTCSYVTWLCIRERTQFVCGMWYASYVCMLVICMSCVYVTWLMHMWEDSFCIWHTYEWVMAQSYLHVICIRDMTLSKSMCHDSCICDLTLWKSMCVACDMHVICMSYAYVTWLVALDTITVCVCDMTCSYVTWFLHMWEHSIRTWHVTCMWYACEIWHTHEWVIEHRLWQSHITYAYDMHVICMWFACDMHVTYICDMTRCSWKYQGVCVCHDLFIRDRTHACVTGRMHTWRDLLFWTLAISMRVPYWHLAWITCKWLIYTWHDPCTCDLTRAYVTWLVSFDIFRSACRDLFIVTWLCQSLCAMTHAYVTSLYESLCVWHDAFIRDI